MFPHNLSVWFLLAEACAPISERRFCMQRCQNATQLELQLLIDITRGPCWFFADFRFRLFCLRYVESATGHRVSAWGPRRLHTAISLLVSQFAKRPPLRERATIDCQYQIWVCKVHHETHRKSKEVYLVHSGSQHTPHLERVGNIFVRDVYACMQ